MITELRAADPAADLDPSAASPAAEAMLRQVLAAPRAESRSRHPRRRLAYGSVAAAAVLAGTALLTGLPGSAPDANAAGYTVARHADGSIEVSIDFDEFRDPAALQRSLQAQGLRAAVLSAEVPATSVSGVANSLYPWIAFRRHGADGPPPEPRPECGKVTLYPGAEEAEAFRAGQLSLRVRPLPAGITFVFEIGMHDGEVQMVGHAAVRGAPPTCF